MSSYEKYQEIQNSGYKWLGKIPNHWGIEYSKWLFSERKEKANRNDEMLTASQKYGVIPQKMFMKMEQQQVVVVQKGQDILKRAVKNDFVISMRSFQGGIEYCPYTGAISSAYVPLKIHEDLSVNFYKYLFKSRPFIQALQSTSNLVRDGQALRYGNFIQVKLPKPPIDEGNKIGEFLDHETSKIDSLIAKQEILIDLLHEKRKVVISHSVTRGLNSDIPMKDSGIEWLGEVPEHWELKKFKYIFKICKRISGELGFDILSITQKGIKVKDISSGDGQLSMDYSKYQLVHKGDFAMNHMDLLTGFVDISRYDGVTSPDYRVFTLEHQQSTAEYYLNILQMGYLDKLFYPLGQGAANIGRWRLPTEAFNEFVAPCPPKKEQEDITNFISTTFQKIDNLLEKATKAVSLMKERKTALISAAVTGKIDVRDWQKQ